MPGGAEAGVSLGISAKTGAGLDSLRWKLLEIAGWNPGAETPWLARERHLRALDDARGHLLLAPEPASDSYHALPLFEEEPRLAHNDLCSISGPFTSDDFLGAIFFSLCIGKCGEFLGHPPPSVAVGARRLK